LHRAIYLIGGKGKGKFTPEKKNHEGPERGQWYSCTLCLTSALDGDWVVNATPIVQEAGWTEIHGNLNFYIHWRTARGSRWLSRFRHSASSRNILRFSLTQTFWPHYGPGVDSASNRNEYHAYLLGIKAAGAYG
jgi:hypothetical protein